VPALTQSATFDV